MPGRPTPIVTDQYYHIFNRGLNRQPTFTKKREYQRAKDSLKYYLHTSPPVSFSRYLLMDSDDQHDVEIRLANSPRLIKLLAYCLMPNHFHFLAKQTADGGVSKLMSNFQNSYTKYFNLKNNRTGALFGDQFKAVLVETDEQLIHLSRYIHLNPYSSFIVENLEDLPSYQWSPLGEYLGDHVGICEPKEILKLFQSSKKYKNFIFDQADYQRKLEKIKHLAVDL